MGKYDYAAAALAPLQEFYLRQKDYVRAKLALDEYRAKSKLLDEKGNPIYPGTEYFIIILAGIIKGLGSWIQLCIAIVDCWLILLI